MQNNNFNISLFSLSILSIGFGICYYRKYCHDNTFKFIEKNYKKKYEWEDNLDIYAIAMPIFYTVYTKKPKCILLIGGYKDIPHIWNEIENYLRSDH